MGGAHYRSKNLLHRSVRGSLVLKFAYQVQCMRYGMGNARDDDSSINTYTSLIKTCNCGFEIFRYLDFPRMRTNCNSIEVW